MITEQTIEQIVFEAMDSHNELHPDQLLDKSPDTKLFGQGARLTSLSLVGLLVDLEVRFGDHIGHELTLADERAFSQRNSPFTDVRSLLSFVQAKLNGTQHEPE